MKLLVFQYGFGLWFDFVAFFVYDFSVFDTFSLECLTIFVFFRG